MPNRVTVSDEEIRLLYEADPHFAPKLAVRLGVSDTAIYQRMKRLGIKPHSRIVMTEEEMRKGYEGDIHFVPKLASRLGVHVATIYQRMKKLGIKSRPMEEAKSDCPTGERCPAWKGGRNISYAGYVMLRKSAHTGFGRGGYVQEHRLIAAKVLGKPLPKGAEVHHVLGAGSEANNRNDNLVICQNHSYHALLHARMRVRDAGGNPNTDRICMRCKQVKQKSSFYKNRSNYDGLTNDCKDCNSASKKARYALRREALVAAQ